MATGASVPRLAAWHALSDRVAAAVVVVTLVLAWTAALL
jgi:hypothetical protein